MPGKRNKKDVQKFSLNLIDNIFELHNHLANHTYDHGPYQAFKINDPKPRHIHKASVRDRLLHHAIYQFLYSFFDYSFSYESFSCRLNKGTHRAIYRFLKFYRKVSRNNTRTCWVLKCDIRKFFDNIDHEVLLNILKTNITDSDIIWLMKIIISSFSKTPGKGLPLGNLTSQLFVNIYMNEFDQFVKRILKVFIKTLNSGVDFLGWVNFPDFRVLRTATKKRMFKRIDIHRPESLNSYSGLLKHGNTYKIRKTLAKTCGI